MKTLDEISTGFRRKTDKSSLFHNYTKLYPLYFEPLRAEKLKLFEIGIDKGSSMKVWKEYFNNAEITGLDILDLKHMTEDRINVVQGDQKDCALLTRTNGKYGPFDIIIDDGSHHNDDMKATFECLFPLLKPGGIYVIEDIHACYSKNAQSNKGMTLIDRLKELVDQVNPAGKSGCANREQDGGAELESMNWWEKNVEFVHLYRSIAFVKKYPPMFRDIPAPVSTSYIMLGNVAKPPKMDYFTPSFFFRLKRKSKKIWSQWREIDSK